MIADTEEPAGLLSDQDLDDLAFELPHIKAWVTAVETEIERALERGVEFKNAKLVPKRATRKWREEVAAIIKRLRRFGKLDEVAPRVPLSPSVFEKTFGKKLYADVRDLVVAESSGLKIAYSHPAEDE